MGNYFSVGENVVSGSRKSGPLARRERWAIVVELLQDVLAECMEHDGRSLAEIAEKAQVSDQTLRRLASETRSPHFTVVLAIFDAYGINFNLEQGNKRAIRLNPEALQPPQSRKQKKRRR